VYSQCERLWLSQEECVPLPVTVSPVLLAVLGSSPCYHAVLPLVRHASGGFDCISSTCACVSNVPKPGEAFHPIVVVPRAFIVWGCSINSCPFVQVCRDAHKGTDKEVQDKNEWNKSAGSSWEHRFPTTLIASAEYGKCWNKPQNHTIQQKASHQLTGRKRATYLSCPSHLVCQRSIARYEEKAFALAQSCR